MKIIAIAGIFSAIIIIGLGIGIGTGYYLRGPVQYPEKVLSVITENPTVTVKKESNPSGCVEGSIRFANDYFSFCYPSYFKKETEASVSSVRFAGNNETLSVAYTSKSKQKIHLCLEESDDVVASMPAHLRIMRKESAAGCEGILRITSQISFPDRTDVLEITWESTGSSEVSYKEFKNVLSSFQLVMTTKNNPISTLDTP